MTELADAPTLVADCHLALANRLLIQQIPHYLPDTH
jgi:hypothetical protein